MANPNADPRRMAQRVQVHLPVELEVLAEPPKVEPPRLEDLGQERLPYPAEMAGARFSGTAADLSIDGAMICAGLAPPLQARVRLTFELDGCGVVSGIGLVMWRRPEFRRVTGAAGREVLLPVSFGVLFQGFSIEVREALAGLIRPA